jgi:hypothetical protein
MFLLFPSSPNKVNIIKRLTRSFLPPVSLFKNTFDYCRVVTKSNPKSISFACLSLITCYLLVFIYLLLLGHVVWIKDCLMELLLHFNLKIQYEFSWVKVLSHISFTIKSFWDLNTHLLNYFIQLLKSLVLSWTSICWNHNITPWTRRDGLRLFSILENKFYNQVDSSNGYVYSVFKMSLIHFRNIMVDWYNRRALFFIFF